SRDGVQTCALPISVDVDDPLVEQRAARGLDRTDDVGGRDGTEQLLRALGGLRRDGDVAEALELGLQLLGVVEVADPAGLLGTPDGADVLLRALRGRDRVAARQQRSEE